MMTAKFQNVVTGTIIIAYTAYWVDYFRHNISFRELKEDDVKNGQ